MEQNIRMTLFNQVNQSYKDKIDYELNKLEIKGYSNLVDVLIVSPLFYSKLKMELVTDLKTGYEGNCFYIIYKKVKIIASDMIKGTYILPYFNPNKFS